MAIAISAMITAGLVTHRPNFRLILMNAFEGCMLYQIPGRRKFNP